MQKAFIYLAYLVAEYIENALKPKTIVPEIIFVQNNSLSKLLILSSLWTIVIF